MVCFVAIVCVMQGFVMYSCGLFCNYSLCNAGTVVYSNCGLFLVIVCVMQGLAAYSCGVCSAVIGYVKLWSVLLLWSV